MVHPLIERRARSVANLLLEGSSILLVRRRWSIRGRSTVELAALALMSCATSMTGGALRPPRNQGRELGKWPMWDAVAPCCAAHRYPVKPRAASSMAELWTFNP